MKVEESLNHHKHISHTAQLASMKKKKEERRKKK